MSRISAAACLALLLGCSSSPERPAALPEADASSGTPGIPGGSGSDAAVDGDAEVGGDVSVDGGECNLLVVDTLPDVERTYVPADTEAPAGGTIAPGAYVLTKFEQFTGAGGDTGGTGLRFQSALTIGASGYERAWVGSGTPLERDSGAWATSGNELTFTRACPDPFPRAYGYTATSTTITLIDAAAKQALTYTKS